MNSYLTWSLFHRSERHYHKLSYQLANTGSRVNELNERRKAIQHDIGKLSEENRECAKCQGACCKGDYDHFTVVDYLIRMFSDKPLNGYGKLWKPKPFQSLILDAVRSHSGQRGGNMEQAARCPHLTLSGCDLEIEDRPVRCILWTCRDFRKALPQKGLMQIGRLMRELDSLSGQVIRVYSHRQ